MKQKLKQLDITLQRYFEEKQILVETLLWLFTGCAIAALVLLVTVK